jgi:hypothetical protein
VAYAIAVAQQVRRVNRGAVFVLEAKWLVEPLVPHNVADVRRVLMRVVPPAKKARVYALRDKIAALW